MENKNKFVLIATPCYGGLLSCEYSRCLGSTKTLLEKNGINMGVAYLSNESLITRGRNCLMAMFLENKDLTHLFFIDADISWRPEDVLKLVRHDKDVVGGCYPKKKVNLQRIPTLVDEIRRLQTPQAPNFNFRLLESKLYDYVVNYFPDKEPVIEKNNLMKVKHIGTGFMMISRKCLDKMVDYYGEMTKHNDDHGGLNERQRDHMYALFDTDIVDGHYLSEDYTFCKRWIDIGGDVYTDLTIKLAHAGTFIFNGDFGSSLISVDKLIKKIENENKTCK